MNETIPQAVLKFFRSRHSRREVFPYELFSRALGGWQSVNFIAKRARRQYGAKLRAWPVDTSHVCFSDGLIFADFARSELKAKVPA